MTKYVIIEGYRQKDDDGTIKEVLDDYFEDRSGTFAEVACRKLVKLGLVEVEGDVYKMKGGAENDK